MFFRTCKVPVILNDSLKEMVVVRIKTDLQAPLMIQPYQNCLFHLNLSNHKLMTKI